MHLLVYHLRVRMPCTEKHETQGAARAFQHHVVQVNWCHNHVNLMYFRSKANIARRWRDANFGSLFFYEGSPLLLVDCMLLQNLSSLVSWTIWDDGERGQYLLTEEEVVDHYIIPWFRVDHKLTGTNSFQILRKSLPLAEKTTNYRSAALQFSFRWVMSLLFISPSFHIPVHNQVEIRWSVRFII